MLEVHAEDAAVFVALQAWWAFTQGESIGRAELFSIVLAEAVSNRLGKLASAAQVGG